jgi:hypothetical protein
MASASVNRAVLGAADVVQVAVLRSHARVVQPRADRVRLDRLPVVVLEQVGACAVQHAGAAAGDRRGVPAGAHAVAAGLQADEADAVVRHEGGEDADGVGAAAHAGQDGVRQPAEPLEQLPAGLVTDDPLEVADHLRERVRAGDGAEDVVRRLDVGHPVAEGLVDRVLEGARAGGDRDDLGAEQPHRATLSAWRRVSSSPM